MMMLDVNRLRCLHAVAVHGSVTRAAAALHLTASAVSQQLSKLEEEVGRALLEKRGRGVRLTEPAMVLAEHASAVLAQLERARADLDATDAEVRGAIRLAMFPTAARGLAPSALTRLRRSHGRLEVGLQELEPAESMALLLRGDLDVAVIEQWRASSLVIPREIERKALLEDQADVAVPRNHRWARRRALEIADLAAERWISWQRGSSCLDWLILLLRTNGIEPAVVHTAAEHPTQLALVAAGLGVAVIPRLGRGAVPHGVRMIPLRPPLSRSVLAVWRANDSRRPGVRALVDALEAAASQIGLRAAHGA
jgi:DNA-binding transcriptional LysR family regulator